MNREDREAIKRVQEMYRNGELDAAIDYNEGTEYEQMDDVRSDQQQNTNRSSERGSRNKSSGRSRSKRSQSYNNNYEAPIQAERKKRTFFSYIWKLILALLLIIALIFGSIYLMAKPINILVIGSDARPGEDPTGNRSDSLILLRADPRSGKVTQFSIARDTYVPLACNGEGEDKITHALVYGGIDCTINTVENFFQISIDKYFFFSFDSFTKLVDDVGGVSVTSNGTFSEDATGTNYDFVEGETYEMNGDMALSYSRHRYSDNDFKRGERQRQIMSAVFQKVSGSNALNIYDTAKTDGQTDFTYLDGLFLYPILFTNREIVNIETEGEGTTIGGTYYYILSDTKKNEITTTYK